MTTGSQTAAFRRLIAGTGLINGRVFMSTNIMSSRLKIKRPISENNGPRPNIFVSELVHIFWEEAGESMAVFQTAGVVVIVAILALVLLIILRKPIKFILKLILNTVVGFLALFAINFLGAAIGISVAVNWTNAVIVGVLGLPGVALILLLRWIFAV
jgi:inhibitor of the pro-sigma K processing machinery